MANTKKVEDKDIKKNKSKKEKDKDVKDSKKKKKEIVTTQEKNNKKAKKSKAPKLETKITNKGTINKKKASKKSFSTIEVVFLIVVTCIVSLIIGAIITYNLNKNKITNNDKNIEKFIKNYNYILDNYYEDVDKSKLINNAIKGMLEALDDDYSYLIDETESNSFNIELEGEYKGIGVEIVSVSDGTVYVYNVFKNSPAEKAGIETGDIIKKIDGKDFSDKTSNEIATYIQNSKKTNIKIVLERNGEEKTVTVKKEKVTIEAVESKIINKNNKKIGYMKISVFSSVAYKQFKEKLENLEDEKIDSLIIDVRDNTGGHLTTATNILSLFLDSSHVIYQTQTKTETKKYYSSGRTTKEYKIVVLQNSNSASASEMLSAALKEEYGATVIGETSYGKGTVQEMVDLSDGAEYKITTKKWLTPKGNWINKKGVEPDIKVELDEKYNSDPTEENDNQLNRAISELTK